MTPLLNDLFSDLDSPLLYWQLGLILASLVLALAINQSLRAFLPHAERGSKLHIGLGSAARVIFPLSAMVGVVIGGAVMRHLMPGHYGLLRMAVSLLAALALVRVVVYILRHVFAPGGGLKAWERLLSAIIWLGFALHLTGLLPGVLEALDEYSIHLGKQRVSLLLVIEAVVTLAASLVISLWLGREAENRILKADSLDMNLRVVLAKIARALLVLTGLLVALSFAGIDLTLLSVFGGALGVGLGFGLQKIASNYVSGFIILLDRSIRIGDLVTIDGRYGSVSTIATRYVVVKGMDGTESLIPNETLITSPVINHSYTDPKVRVALPIQVSYDTDMDGVLALLLTIGQSHPRVLQDPPPRAYLKEFADSGINLELAVWIRDPEEGQLNLRSDLNLAIWRAFREHGIEIPFPQREVRILGPLTEDEAEVAILGEQRMDHDAGH